MESYWLELMRSYGEPQLEELIVAQTPEEKLEGSTEPVRFWCSDEKYYCVKPSNAGRSLIADHVVGAIGWELGYPVPKVTLVSVPEEIIRYDGSICSHFRPGIAHASEWLEGVHQYNTVLYATDDGNPLRFSELAVLYGITKAADVQYLYKRNMPHHVYSHDHGLFFPGHDAWSVESLEQAARDEFVLDRYICTYITLPSQCTQDAKRRLGDLDDSTIAKIVRSIPSSWGITYEQRHALCAFIACGRDRMTGISVGRSAL